MYCTCTLSMLRSTCRIRDRLNDASLKLSTPQITTTSRPVISNNSSPRSISYLPSSNNRTEFCLHHPNEGITVYISHLDITSSGVLRQIMAYLPLPIYPGGQDRLDAIPRGRNAMEKERARSGRGNVDQASGTGRAAAMWCCK
jgi:hypothetical protein